jgi:hypothetical protein
MGSWYLVRRDDWRYINKQHWAQNSVLQRIGNVDAWYDPLQLCWWRLLDRESPSQNQECLLQLWLHNWRLIHQNWWCLLQRNKHWRLGRWCQLHHYRKWPRLYFMRNRYKFCFNYWLSAWTTRYDLDPNWRGLQRVPCACYQWWGYEPKFKQPNLWLVQSPRNCIVPLLCFLRCSLLPRW